MRKEDDIDGAVRLTMEEFKAVANNKDFTPAVIGAGPEDHAAAAVIAAAGTRGILLVEDVNDLLDKHVRNASRLAALPQPLVIPSRFKSAGRGTNMTPKKKRRKK